MENYNLTKFKEKPLVYMIDIMAYMGAIWFFLTKFICGPIVDHLNKNAEREAKEVSQEMNQDEIELSQNWR